MKPVANCIRGTRRIFLPLFFFVFCLSVYGQTISQVTAGYGHSLFLKSDGSLWGMGRDDWGQLGFTQPPYSTNNPVEIISDNVTNIAAGINHSLFITSDGSLWTMGYNSDGQLGDGTFDNTNLPIQIVSSDVDVIAVAAGGRHSLFIKSDGSLWGMGCGLYGELGMGTWDSTNKPEQVVANGVIAVAAGWNHSLFLKSDGSLWGMGANGAGELGDGTTLGINHPEQIVSNGVVAIAAGYEHSLFLKSDGSLWAMGYNRFGQLGDGTTVDSHTPELIVSNGVIAIAGGGYHSLFLKTDGSLWAMGWNEYGQLGDGSTNNINQPKKIISDSVVAVAGGAAISLFIKSDGSLWGMGGNWSGDLGDGTYIQRSWPVPVLPAPPTPFIHSWNISGTNLLFEANNGLAGGTYFMLMSSDLTLPLTQWIRIATNMPLANGDFALTATNAFNPNIQQRFYCLQLLR